MPKSETLNGWRCLDEKKLMNEKLGWKLTDPSNRDNSHQGINRVLSFWKLIPCQ
jgi:hypothetical protein